MNIRVAELRQATELLLTALEEDRGPVLDIASDYYWEVPPDKRYDVADQPAELSMGQLSHDVERLRELLQGQAPPVVASLGWLGAVLLYLGEQDQE